MSYQEDNLKAIADAIREKDGTTGTIMPLDFPDRIRAIKTGIDTSDATATASDILSGKTAYVKEQKIIGTYVPPSNPEKYVYNGMDCTVESSNTLKCSIPFVNENINLFFGVIFMMNPYSSSLSNSGVSLVEVFFIGNIVQSIILYDYTNKKFLSGSNAYFPTINWTTHIENNIQYANLTATSSKGNFNTTGLYYTSLYTLD